MKFRATPDDYYVRVVDENGEIEINDEAVECRRAQWYKRYALHDPEIMEDRNLAFCCAIDENIAYIQQHIADPDITAAMFGTETGDYEPLYIRYGYPSFRSGGPWYKVIWR